MAHTGKGTDAESPERRAIAWMAERLAAAGWRRTGAVTRRRERPWGRVSSAPTDRGLMWLKAPGPGLAAEIGLHGLLARVAPDEVPELIAADPAGGLLLLADGGVMLSGCADGPGLIDALAGALPRYARLQRALTPYASEMLALGVPDMRAAALPARFDEALRVATGYSALGGAPDAAAEIGALTALRTTVTRWCERLDAAAVPPTLDHNDLHANNVLIGADGHVRFADWGDAVVGHPFAGMRVTLGILARNQGLGTDDPVIIRLRDAYLAEFADLAPYAALVGELELACRLTAITGALTCDRALAGAAPAEAVQYADDPLRRLRALTEDSWLTMPL